MATSLLFIRKLVRDRLGIPMHDSYFPDPLIDANINLAILAIEESHRWPWNETIGTFTLDNDGASALLPEDWRATKAIVDQGGDALELCVSYDLERYRQGNTQGHPGWFCIIADSVYFAPIGSGEVFTHYYYRSPKLLNVDEDVIRMPSQHVGTIVAKASQLCSTREADRPSAAVHLMEYQEGIERMRKDTKPSTRPQQKRIRPGAWT
jgi:hypothetical protein